MTWTAATLSLLTAAAGWYYLFYSQAAGKLADLEEERLNRRRRNLRRVGGGIMLLLGIGLYLGFAAASADANPRLFVAVWLAVMCLMAGLVVLAMIDLRLTIRLRKRQRLRNLIEISRNQEPPLDRDREH